MSVCVVMRRTGPLEPNAPKEEEIPSRSEARSHSVGFHQTAQTGSWQNTTVMNEKRKWWGEFKSDWGGRKEISILKVIQWTSSNIPLRKEKSIKHLPIITCKSYWIKLSHNIQTHPSENRKSENMKKNQSCLKGDSYIYSDRGALDTACVGGCRLVWLPMLLL